MRSTATKSPNRLLSPLTDMIGSFMVHQFYEYVFDPGLGRLYLHMPEPLCPELPGESTGVELPRCDRW